MSIYDRVKVVRKACKLTQSEFGERLGVSRDVIGNIEYSRVEPSELILRQICASFNISENWLRTGEGDMRAPVSSIDALANEFSLDGMERAIVESFVRLPEQYREGVKQFVHELVSRVSADPQLALREELISVIVEHLSKGGDAADSG